MSIILRFPQKDWNLWFGQMSIQSWTSVTLINLFQKCDFYFFREKARGKNCAEKISTEIGNLAAAKDGAYSVKSYSERCAYIEQGECRKK